MTRSVTDRVPPPVVVCVGGSTSDGDTGIQADLKVVSALRCRGTAVVTGTVAGAEVYPLPATVVRAQLDTALSTPPGAMKVGMVADPETGAAVASRARAGMPNLVLDPVLVHPPGRKSSVVAAYRRLLPYATVVTPSLDEAAALVGWPVITPADMGGAASTLAGEGAQVVVVTGGGLPGDELVDVVWVGNGIRQLRRRRLPGPPVRGAGDAFAAAVAAQLAYGLGPVDAVEYARLYVGRVISGAAGTDQGGLGAADFFEWAQPG